MSFDDYGYNISTWRNDYSARSQKVARTEVKKPFENASQAKEGAAQEVIANILQQFQNIGFTSPLAGGGALRDIDHGKSIKDIKDIDIIVNVHDLIDNNPDKNYKLENIKHVIEHLLKDQFRSTTTQKDSYGFAILGLQRHWKDGEAVTGSFMLTWNGINIDVSFVPWQTTVENWFTVADFGLSRIAMTADGTVHKSKDYEHDKQNKAFVVRACYDYKDLGNSMIRYHNVSKRYPDYGFGMPLSMQDQYEKAMAFCNKTLSFESYKQEERLTYSCSRLIHVDVWEPKESPILKPCSYGDELDKERTMIICNPADKTTVYVDALTNQRVLSQEDGRILEQLRTMLGHNQ